MPEKIAEGGTRQVRTPWSASEVELVLRAAALELRDGELWLFRVSWDNVFVFTQKRRDVSQDGTLS